ncbi:uncharacterized protein [Pyxicephalus adspersus]|uniref:uncharacterized protein n=1 Tax=Pyxicephalus adspersus TaxID=30357 RepID=UPI003B5CE490
MKTCILILFTFSLSLDVACGIKCYECQARNADHCVGKEHQCPEGSSCMTVSELFMLNNKTNHSIQKRCSLNVACNTTQYSLVSEKAQFDILTTCCERDLCNDGGFQMPKITTDRKGYECPACVSVGTELCTPNITTTCREESDKCALFVGSFKSPDDVDGTVTGQGCASLQVCSHDYTQAVGLYVKDIKEFKCYDPEIKPQPVVKNSEE